MAGPQLKLWEEKKGKREKGKKDDVWENSGEKRAASQWNKRRDAAATKSATEEKRRDDIHTPNFFSQESIQSLFNRTPSCIPRQYQIIPAVSEQFQSNSAVLEQFQNSFRAILGHYNYFRAVSEQLRTYSAVLEQF